MRIGVLVKTSVSSVGHSILVLSTLAASAIALTLSSLHSVNEKQSLYATTQYSSHLCPHQLSISIILPTNGSQVSPITPDSPMKCISQGLSGHGVGAIVGVVLGLDVVGNGVGSGVGTGVGSGVGAADGGIVCASSMGGIDGVFVGRGVGNGVGSGVGLGEGNGVGNEVGNGVG
jgi:hypothetical protein